MKRQEQRLAGVIYLKINTNQPLNHIRKSKSASVLMRHKKLEYASPIQLQQAIFFK